MGALEIVSLREVVPTTDPVTVGDFVGVEETKNPGSSTTVLD